MIYIYYIFNFLPFIASFVIVFLPNTEGTTRVIKYIGLTCTTIIFISSLTLWFFFNKLTNRFQFIQNIDWVSVGNSPLFYENAIDGISIFFILLTTLLFPLCILSSWYLVDKINCYSLKFYIINFLILEFFLINAFTTTNLLLFYVFFESVLIPMMFIIGIWGPGDRKIKANYYFIFYTIAGSALLLFSIIAIAFDLDPNFVAFHHIIRLLMILFTVPIILKLIKKTNPEW